MATPGTHCLAAWVPGVFLGVRRATTAIRAPSWTARSALIPREAQGLNAPILQICEPKSSANWCGVPSMDCARQTPVSKHRSGNTVHWPNAANKVERYLQVALRAEIDRRSIPLFLTLWVCSGRTRAMRVDEHVNWFGKRCAKHDIHGHVTRARAVK